MACIVQNTGTPQAHIFDSKYMQFRIIHIIKIRSTTPLLQQL